MDQKAPTCFTCGLALTDPPRLNHLPSGAVCPSCRDRLLEVLPPLLPGGELGAAPRPEPDHEPDHEPVTALQASQDTAEDPRPPKGPRPSP